MPYINNQYHQFKDKGVQVLSVDSSESELAVNQLGKFIVDVYKKRDQCLKTLHCSLFLCLFLLVAILTINHEYT